MSPSSLRYNNQQLAGPSCKVTPLSFDTPCSPNKLGLPSRQESVAHIQPSEYSMPRILQKRPRSYIDTDGANDCILRPVFRFPSCRDEAMQKDLQFHDRFQPDTYDGHYFSPTVLAGSPKSSGAEDFDADLSAVPHFRPKNQHTELHSIFRHNPCAIRSPLYCQEETSSFFSCHYITPEKFTESPGAPRVVTPTLDEVDELHLDPALQVRRRTLSPYAPMPLQPIFHLEPQCKAIHDTIEPISCFRPPSCDVEDTKSLAIDPRLIPQPPVAGYEAPVTIPFARGSIASEDLWPSSLASKLSAPVYHNLCPPSTTGIPLEIAKQHAQEFRASSPYALSQQFLLSFMGQSDERFSWLCYIRGCGKQLTRKSHMIDHIRMHLDERVYACEYCPQTFLRKADCKRHTAAHNPEKAFQCDLCAKSFGRKDLLTRHKRKCESTFSMTSSYRVVGDTKRLSRKRKSVQGNSIPNTPTTQNVGYVAENVFSIPPDHIKRNNHGFVWDSDGYNKENIPPSPEDKLRAQKRARGLF